MPLPLVFIGIAVVTGATGAGATVKAGVDHSKAKKINSNTEERIAYAANRLNTLREQCGDALQHLGEEKLFVLSGSIASFLDTFTKIKNVDFADSEGLSELSKFHVDETTFEEIGELGHFAASLATGSIAGAAGGALTALGAYSAAATFATASTGTAISTLSGAAASNATLAFFGGGSLATGGLGMAGGTAVLGGLVAGPALLVMGVITGVTAEKGLEDAKKHAAEADVICEQLEIGVVQCIGIRRRTYLFHNLLARLDAQFLPLIHAMEEIVANEGTNYATYKPESKKIIASVASTAVSIKAILDTPILSADGTLTEDSKVASEKIAMRLTD